VSEITVNEDLLDRYRQTGVPVYRLYEPPTLCAVLGASGKPERDLLLENLDADRVPWMRRRGGGGTVILGPGQVVLALVTSVESPFRNREYAAEINSWIADSLALLGVTGVHPEGISDLAIGSKKIVGTSLYRTRLVLFYQASLLVSNDIAVFTRYLAMPTKVPEYRDGRSHEEFCTTIAREGYAATVREVMGAMESVVSTRLPILR
jgi:lipoate-protein ligase A